MSIVAIIVRCLFAYVILLTLLRLTGKRTIYEGTPLDFVVALIIGDLIDDLLWSEISAAQFVVAAGTLFILHAGASIAAHVYPRMKELLDGKERPMVEHGEIRWDQLQIAHLNHGELMELLRQKNVKDVREVSAANVECSGTLSVLLKGWARHPNKLDHLPDDRHS